MRISKKLTATLLAAIIAVNSVPVTAFADGEGTSTGTTLNPGVTGPVNPGDSDDVKPGKVAGFTAVSTDKSVNLTWTKGTDKVTGYEVSLTDSFVKSYTTEAAVAKWTGVELSGNMVANFGSDDLSNVESITLKANDKMTKWALGFNDPTYNYVQSDSVKVGSNESADFNKAGDTLVISASEFAQTYCYFKLGIAEAEAGAAITWTVNYKNGYSETKTVDADATSAAFDGLKASTKYTASIVAVNGKAKSDAEVVEFTTKAPPKTTSKLSITAGTNGTVAVKKGSTALKNGDTVTEGDKLTITATPKAGYKASLTVTGATKNSDGTYTVNKGAATVGVKATFAIKQAIVKLGTGVTVKAGTKDVANNAKVNVGTTLTITPKPNSGYKVSKVTVNIKTVNAVSGKYTYKVGVNDTTVTIKAAFVKKQAIVKLGTGVTVKAGTTNVANNAKVNVGTTLTITPKPNSGYKVSKVTVNNKTVNAVKGKYTYKVGVNDTTVTIKAAFVKKQATVKIGTSKTGKVTVKAGKTAIANNKKVNVGTTLTLTPAANKGYKVSKVTVNNKTVVAKKGVYTYKVGANDTTVSVKVAFTAIKPAATKKITASKTMTTVTLKWSGVSYATKYTVTYKVGKKTITKTATKPTLTVTGLKAGAKYTFTVTAYNGNVKGGAKTLKNVATLKAPAKVASLKASAVKTTSLKLTWAKNVDAKNGYKVTYKVSGKTKTVVVKKGTSVNIKGLKKGTKYSFTVVAVNGKINGAKAVVNVTTKKK